MNGVFIPDLISHHKSLVWKSLSERLDITVELKTSYLSIKAKNVPRRSDRRHSKRTENMVLGFCFYKYSPFKNVTFCKDVGGGGKIYIFGNSGPCTKNITSTMVYIQIKIKFGVVHTIKPNRLSSCVPNHDVENMSLYKQCKCVKSQDLRSAWPTVYEYLCLAIKKCVLLDWKYWPTLVVFWNTAHSLKWKYNCHQKKTKFVVGTV